MKRTKIFLILYIIVFVICLSFASSAAQDCAQNVVFRYNIQAQTWSISGNTSANFLYVSVYNEYDEIVWSKRIASKDGAFTTGELGKVVLLDQSGSSSGLFYAKLTYNANYNNVVTDLIKIGGTLSEIRADAIQKVESVFAGYVQENYTTSCWDQILQIKKSAIDQIGKMTDSVDMYAAVAEATEKFQQVNTAKEEGLLEIEEHFTNYSSSYYSDSDWKEMLSIKEKAIEDIEANIKASTIGKIISNALDSFESVSTLAEEGAEAILAEFAKYSSEKYTAMDWAEIEAIKDQSIVAVNNNPGDAQVIDAIVKGAAKDMSFVSTISQQVQKVLRAAYDKYDANDYSVSEYGKLTLIFSKALGKTGNLKESEMDSFIEGVIAEMDAVPDLKDEGINKLNDIFYGYDKQKYSTAAYQAIVDLRDEAIDDIRNSPLEDMEGIISYAAEKMSTVQNLVDEAIERLNSEFAKFNKDDYSDIVWNNLVSIKDRALAELSGLVDYTKADGIVTKALADLEEAKYDTSLDDVKERLKASLKAEYEKYISYGERLNFTKEEKDILTAVYNSGVASIDDARNEEALTVASAKAMADLEDAFGYDSFAKIECLDIADLITSEKSKFSNVTFEALQNSINDAINGIDALNESDYSSESEYQDQVDIFVEKVKKIYQDRIYVNKEVIGDINDFLKSLKSSDYSDVNWIKIKGMTENAINQLNSLDSSLITEENCRKIYDQTVEQINGVITKAEEDKIEAQEKLEKAKNDAKLALEQELAKYDKNLCVPAKWTEIINKVDSASAQIDNAAEISQVQSILADAVKFIQNNYELENDAPIPTAKPTATPTAKPTATPTAKPTATPTAKPTATPTAKPTATPTGKPADDPTATPTVTPEETPSASATPGTDVPSTNAPSTDAPVAETPTKDPEDIADVVEGNDKEPPEDQGGNGAVVTIVIVAVVLLIAGGGAFVYFNKDKEFFKNILKKG